MTPKRHRAGFYLDMPFEEALERYAGVPIHEINAAEGKSRKKKPRRAKKKTPRGSKAAKNVILLKDRKASRRRRGLA
jgi:hypothetical protein